MYRGSNSDTQLTWGTKLAWADSDANEGSASRAGASPCTVRPGSSNRVRKDKTVHWEEWTVDEVLVWLASLDVEVKECSEVFRKQRVKGKHLKKLDDELLLKLGIDAFGDRDAILEARDHLSDDQERIRLAAAARATGSNPNSPAVKSLPSPGPGTPAAGTPRLKPSSSSFPGSDPPPAECANEAQVLVGGNSGDPLVVYTERPLGGGAAGSVFEGWYQGQYVAVKRMSETEKQAVKELDIYRNSAANRHPNIVFTHGFKVEHGLVYLIMDRCDCSLSTSAGETSSAFVRKLRVSSDLPRELAKQLLTGISQLHSLHVIHRDLKPSNVLVRNSAAVLEVEGSAPREKRNGRRQPQLCLCDMGLSKRQSADYSISTLGDDVGTVGWRAPELRKAGAQATEASDVYAAGLIMYYILTGGCHVFDDDEDERIGHEDVNERQLSQLSYARQEAIDECGREWERVQKYGSRGSTTNVFALSASHRDLLSAEKEAEREQLIEGIVERLSMHRVHARQGAGQEASPPQGLRLPSSRLSNDGSITEISTEAVSLLSRLLHPDPKKRPTAGEALADPVFQVVLEGQDQIAEPELTIGGVIGDGAMGIVSASGVHVARWRLLTVRLACLLFDCRSTERSGVRQMLLSND
jgi:serine/threonine protein kinase